MSTVGQITLTFFVSFMMMSPSSYAKKARKTNLLPFMKTIQSNEGKSFYNDDKGFSAILFGDKKIFGSIALENGENIHLNNQISLVQQDPNRNHFELKEKGKKVGIGFCLRKNKSVTTKCQFTITRKSKKDATANEVIKVKISYNEESDTLHSSGSVSSMDADSIMTNISNWDTEMEPTPAKGVVKYAILPSLKKLNLSGMILNKSGSEKGISNRSLYRFFNTEKRFLDYTEKLRVGAK